MSNNKSGDYTIKITCGEKQLVSINPKKQGLNDQIYMQNNTVNFKFD